MGDENKKIDGMTDEEVIEGITILTAGIIKEMQSHNHEPVKMTEAELWESYVHPFED